MQLVYHSNVFFILKVVYITVKFQRKCIGRAKSQTESTAAILTASTEKIFRSSQEQWRQQDRPTATTSLESSCRH